MFCDRCGTPLSPNSQFCASCGKQVISAHPVQSYAAPIADRVSRHINLLATLWLVSGVLRLFGVLAFAIFGRVFMPGFFRGFGPFGPHWPFGGWFPGGFYSLGVMLGLFGVLHLVLAWGLYDRQSWARMLGLILAFLALFRVPFGTALGIYTLWVLLPESSSREYARLAHA